MHPAHIPSVKQRVLGSEVAAIKPLVDRMRRSDDPARVAGLLTRVND